MKHSSSNRPPRMNCNHRTSPTPRPLRLESLEPRQLLHAAAIWSADVPAEGEGTPVAEFALTDTNATSPSSGQEVSPRDYLGQVTGWYFGSAL